MKADANTELIALGDVFADKLDTTFVPLSTEYKERVNVPPERRSVGLDAYQKVIDSGVDVVLLAAPGGFRPPHLKAAIEAGKHVFCEKPMAIDGPGLRSAIASVALAKQKNLALRSGLCMRFDAKLMEAMRRIHGGAIGEVVAIYSSRMGGPLTKKFNGQRLAGWTDLEWQLRNWSNFVWLSGDWMMEVNVHSVDKMAWAMDDVPPVRCVATGGRQVPAYGNIYDHFDVTYEYANGMLSTLKTRYQDGCYGEHRDVIVGTKGRCVLGWTDAVITGAENWALQRPANQHAPGRARRAVQSPPGRNAAERRRQDGQEHPDGDHGTHGRLHRQADHLGTGDGFQGKPHAGQPRLGHEARRPADGHPRHHAVCLRRCFENAFGN